jgi:hypothetical protein
LRAGEAARRHNEENGEWKFLVYDSLSNEARTPGGFVGHRRGNIAITVQAPELRKVTHPHSHFPQNMRFYFSQTRCFRMAHSLLSFILLLFKSRGGKVAKI